MECRERHGGYRGSGLLTCAYFCDLSGKVPGVPSRYLGEVGCWDSAVAVCDADCCEKESGGSRYVDGAGRFTEVADAMAPLVKGVVSQRGRMRALMESWAEKVSHTVLLRSAKGGEGKVVAVAVDGVGREARAEGAGKQISVCVHKEGHTAWGVAFLQGGERVAGGSSGMVGGLDGVGGGEKEERGMHTGLAGLEAVREGEAVIIGSLRMLGVLVEK